ncbi:hypothetical protein HK405_004570 [Cladochytrium tenue]|nr:hypothetical protein HK405_004570 [Cladochytrium tenue]
MIPARHEDGVRPGGSHGSAGTFIARDSTVHDGADSPHQQQEQKQENSRTLAEWWFGRSSSKNADGRNHSRQPGPTPTAECSDLHTITANDTCITLASSYNVTLDSIFSLNNITNTTCSALSNYVGQLLCVGDPAAAYGMRAPAPLSNCTLLDTVLANDTCEALTDFYGISVDDLLAYNNITNTTCQHLADFAGDPVCVALEPITVDPPTPVASCARVFNATAGDSCDSIAAAGNVSIANLLAYNQITSLSCTFLANFLPAAMCVAVVAAAKPKVIVNGLLEDLADDLLAPAGDNLPQPGDAGTAGSPSSDVFARTSVSSDADPAPTESLTASATLTLGFLDYDDTTDTAATLAAAPTDGAESTPVTAQVSFCQSCGKTYASGSDYVAAHNYFRELYGLSPLTADSGLEADAAAAVSYFDGGERACGDVTHDSSAGDAGEGENLWSGMSSSSDYQSTITINDAVNDWMSEDSDC